MAKTTLALITILLHVVLGQNNFVPNVQQNYVELINQFLNGHIKTELTASFIYQGYASYFQRADVSLPGISKFFHNASLEKRANGKLLIDYVNKRGGYTQFYDIDLLGSCNDLSTYLTSNVSGLEDRSKRMCICGFIASKISAKCAKRETWQEGLMAFEDALSIERYVNKQLFEIHNEADKEKDAHLSHTLEHEFLEEQVNFINQLAHYVTRLRKFAKGNNYKLGEYIFDQHIA